MSSLQLDIMVIIAGYVIAFIIYWINKDLGLMIKTALNYIVIAFVMYLMICSIV